MWPDASDGGWDSFADDARTMAKSQLKAVEVACERIFKTAAAGRSKPDKAIDDSEAAEFDKLTALTKELNIISKQLVVPILHIAEKQKR